MSNFFQNMLDSAFANDPNLSQNDKVDGSIDEGTMDDDDYDAQSPAFTPVQQQWRQQQQQEQQQQRKQGAPLATSQLLEHTTWTLDLFLTGIPSKDPTNDLYGAPINISTRTNPKKDNANAADATDSQPTVSSVQVTLLPNGVCTTLLSPFTSGSRDGQWKLSDDGRMLRFGMDVVGYTRTVQTRGTITKVFWSKTEEDAITKTSTEYTIPPGWVYADVDVTYGSRPGTLVMQDGMLRVEQTMGFLKAASKMVPCGTFRGTLVVETDDN